MPNLTPERLRAIAADLLEAAGAPRDEAETVARHCIEANLAGHDSHGIIQIPSYVDRIDKGHIVPGAKYEVTQESPTTTVVDAHWGFGYVQTERAMRATIEKAKTQNVAACTIFRQGHVGRVAAYPLMAAAEGMIGLMTADSGRSAKQVVPFGGREARLGTNPMSIAVPSNLDGPLFFDLSTAAAAAGKIKLADARGEQVPDGWLIGPDGQPTTDPKVLGNGGALLPLGGNVGFKGYALSAMVEILSALLTGLGFGVEPTGRHNDGCFIACFKVEAFRSLDTFKQEVTEFAAYLKDTKPAPGFDEIFYPGEIEHLRKQERLETGVEIEDATWNRLGALAEKLGLPELATG